MRTLAFTSFLVLGCAGGVPGGSGGGPADVVPEPAPSDAPRLASWQAPFAARTDKDVLDYLMLLEADRFLCEAVGVGPLDEAGRRGRVRERHVDDGYLLVEAETGSMQVARFRDRAQRRDVIGTVVNCGLGCMCNRATFEVFDEDTHTWSTLDVVPEARIDARVAELRGDAAWWLDLPIRGTSIGVIDADGEQLLQLDWSGGALVIAE